MPFKIDRLREKIIICVHPHTQIQNVVPKGALNQTLVPLRHNRAERKILKAKRVHIQFIVIEYLRSFN